ncbi:Squamosa promoter-binding-like protein 12 [Platanthera guangdongensis]|uniref:Squamosa promoter-binding-like protein 12 n=1 Tax=Platanthera guangdongensis TaxID=2320717 RepID=A0ABR2MXS2_9ASPA
MAEACAISLVFTCMEGSLSTSNLNGAPDLRRALSLLSNESCGPCNTSQSNMFPFARMNSVMPSYSPVQAANSLPECWPPDEHLLAEQALAFNFHGNGSQFQELHLSKVPYGSPLFEGNQVFSKSDGHFLEFKT